MATGRGRRAGLFAGAALLLAGLAASTLPARAAPTCIVNRSGQALLLVVDDLAGGRISRTTAGSVPLCLEIPAGQGKALVGVFTGAAALEGCSRLSAPGRIETLEAFAAFDNCRWQNPPPGGH